MEKKSLYQPLVQNLISAFGERVKAVVLFGSQARSKYVLERDHDIFVIVEHLSQKPLQRLREMRNCILDIPLEINFIAKTPQEVEINLTPLMLEICVDGICLYGEDYYENYRQRGLRALRQSGLKRKRVGKEWYWKFEAAPKRNWELTWEGFHEF